MSLSDLSPFGGPVRPRHLRLHGDEIAVETVHGFWVVVPAWNLDVALGVLRDGQIEPWTNRVFVDLLEPGATVVNVGANFGYYAALAAKHVGDRGVVHAIEANPVMFPYLVKSAFWSGSPNIVRAYNFAAVRAEDDGAAQRFAFDPQFIGGGNLFSRARDASTPLEACFWSRDNVESLLDANRMFIPRGLYREVEITGRALDTIVHGPIDVMLIDAEGSESFVIDGARRLIAESPELRILLEWDPHSWRAFERYRPTIEAMWSFLLDEQGFSMWRVTPETYTPLGPLPLAPLERADLYDVPHSDLLLKRRSN